MVLVPSMTPYRLLLHQIIIALRIVLATRGVSPTRYPHLKRYVRQLMTEELYSRSLRRL
jgi:hypothetical protein